MHPSVVNHEKEHNNYNSLHCNWLRINTIFMIIKQLGLVTQYRMQLSNMFMNIYFFNFFLQKLADCQYSWKV